MDSKLGLIIILFTLLNYINIVRGRGCLTCSEGLEQKCCKRFRLCCESQQKSNTGTSFSSTNEPLPRQPLPPSTNAPLPSSTNSPLPSSTNSPLPSSTNSPLPSSTNSPLPSSTNAPLPSKTNAPLTSSTKTPLISSTIGQLPSSTNEPLNSSIKKTVHHSKNDTLLLSEMKINNEQPISTTQKVSTEKPKWGRCPVDRFADTIVTRTVCLRRTCSTDSDCILIQKCCPYGETKCCVYPLFISRA